MKTRHRLRVLHTGSSSRAPMRRLHHLRLIAAAQTPADVVSAAQAYLRAWPLESIALVQAIDAGWAPFDAERLPVTVLGAEHLRCIRDALHAHCMALREAGFAPTPELAELEEFFYVANRRAEAVTPAGIRRGLALVPAL